MDKDVVRTRLEAERQRLTAVLDTLEASDGTIGSAPSNMGELSNADQHQADAGTETLNNEVDASTAEQLRAELEEVDAAVERLGDGSYGTCTACGRPVGDARLEALPATRFCVEDQAAAENEAAGRPAGFEV